MTLLSPNLARRPAPAASYAGPVPGGHIVLDGMSWDYYDHTLRQLAETHFRVTFHKGRMEIMSPSGRHQGVKSCARRLIELYTFERAIRVVPLGSVTCRRADLEAGVEPDECYYVHRVPADPYGMSLDLTVEPPPDLALEVDITSGSVPREPIYAALGVPEIWRFDQRRAIPRHRQPDGTYRDEERSLAFPELSMPEFNRFLGMMLDKPVEQHATLKAFQQWARAQGAG